VARHHPQLEQGSIVWVDIADPRGVRKRRPAVILSASDEKLPDAPVEAVAITTTFPDPIPHTHIELPWHPKRHPATGLTRRSAAVCSWLVELRPSQAVEPEGYVPTNVMLRIVERVAELKRHGE